MFTPTNNQEQFSANSGQGKEPVQDNADEQLDVHTMPEKFFQSTMTPPEHKQLNWVILGVIVFLVLGGIIAGVLYFINQQAVPTVTELPQQPANNNANQLLENENANLNANDNQNQNVNSGDILATPSARDAQRLTDISALRSALALSAGTLQIYPNSLASLVGPILKELPLNPSAVGESVPYIYLVSEDKADYEISFSLEQGGEWGIVKLPQGDYLATASGIIPASSGNNSEQGNGNENTNSGLPEVPSTPVVPSKGLDSDGDQLTDIEENLYQTNPALADTDADDFTDAAEILSLYDPIKSKARLVDSGLVGIYQNPTYGSSVFYPKSWSVRSLNPTNSEVIFTSNTGEFIETIVQPNALGVSARNWYLDKNKTADPASLKNVVVGGLPAIQTADGLTTYLAVGSNVYILSYDIGNQQQMNFYATYELFLKSFIFLQGV
ncbi:MAG: hypothetical protein WCV73_01850 [Patescibacteria group bacterium]|jgi:hypothetical protein